MYQHFFQKQRAKRRDKLNIVRMGAKHLYHKYGEEHLIEKTLDKDYHDKSRAEVVKRLDNLLPELQFSEAE